MPNPYFSFPYEPTTFTDKSACNSAVLACSKNYDTCVNQLQDGNGYGVTINVPEGGGRTVDGGDAGLGTRATSICASLSSQACFETSKCDSLSSSNAGIHGRVSGSFIAVSIGVTFILAI